MSWRVGIVGSGFGGSVHAPAFTVHPRFEVVALASPTNAARVAAERHIPHAFDSLEALLAGVDVDVVSIAAPPEFHHDAVLKALAAGKHVLCEKPFALNLTQAREMAAAAERAGTACAIAHEFRYAPPAATLHAMIAQERIAALREIEITVFRDDLRGTNERPRSPWWFSRARGGGLANAVLPHLADLATWFAGRPPQRTAGFGRTAVPNRHDAQGAFSSDVFDGVFATIDYGAGLVARLTVDATTSMNQTTMALHAEEISVVASGEFLLDMRLFSVEPDEQSEFDLSPSPYAKYVSLGANVPSFLSLLDDFAERIDNGGGNAPTFAEALVTQGVLAAVGYEVAAA